MVFRRKFPRFYTVYTRRSANEVYCSVVCVITIRYAIIILSNKINGQTGMSVQTSSRVNEFDKNLSKKKNNNMKKLNYLREKSMRRKISVRHDLVLVVCGRRKSDGPPR